MTTWLQHVKQVHASGSTSFKESMKRASASWKKKKEGAVKAPKKRRGKKKAVEEAEPSTASPVVVKKKRRRGKKAGPVLPVRNFKNIDSRSLR